MNIISIQIIVLLLPIVTIISYTETTTKQTTLPQNTGFRSCQKPKNGQHLCFCGKNNVQYDRLKRERCVKGQVIKKGSQKSGTSKIPGLRLTTKPIHQSTRDDNRDTPCIGLRFKPSPTETKQAYVPLRNVSVEAWIDSFAADVTLTQVFINQEENPIEAIYVFPIEENAAVYSFTAEFDNRTITAVLKEKKTAEEEYKSAVEQGQTAFLMRQSRETLDTFTVNVGALPPGKECRIMIQYVTELDLIDGNAIRFVVPTTIAPRYNPSFGRLQSPDRTAAEYVQNTSYSMWFQAHILRGEEYKIKQVANLSHPVNVSISGQSIDVSSMAIALDRDIILDIDLPDNRPLTRFAIEQYSDTSKYAVLLAFTPRLSDFIKITNGKDTLNTEFIFIVDCSGSMTEDNRIGLAREAMLLFIRSLPVGAHFNIIRFGSNFDILFKNETLTAVYDEQTAKEAEKLTRSMQADFGGTELLEPLKHLNDHPPIKDRSRQIFLLTDGEISNTNEVIELCRSMASTTRIFSFGLGHSPSHSLVKGLARATNGHFVFVPPNSKVDTYVGSQLGRALQPSLVNAHLEWYGLSKDGLQAPKKIPPLYINDCVLVYELLEGDELKNQNISVALFVGDYKMNSIKLSGNIAHKRDTIRRLAAKALIQELQHETYNVSDTEYVFKDKQDFFKKKENNSTLEQQITTLSMSHQILSPYTAFVAIETTGPKNNNTGSKVRHIPIQISKGGEHLFSHQSVYSFPNRGARGPMGFFSGHHAQPVAMPYSMGYGSGRPVPAMTMHGPMLMDKSHYSFHRGPPGPQKAGNSWIKPYAQHDSDESSDIATTTPLLSADPVRWLIDQQSFNGAWLLNENDIRKLTNGKSLSAFISNVTKAKDALTTALAIAILELKHADQKNLWYGVTNDHEMKHYFKSLPQLNLIPALPKNPRNYPIILIGAGTIITSGHLPAYKIAGFSVKVYNTINEACTTSTDENIISDLAVASNQIQSILKQLPINSHALIQKPLGENFIDAQSIVNICKQRHIHGSINFQLRYASYILALKDAIRLGWLGGQLTTIEIHVNVHMPWPLWPFLATVQNLELTYHSIHYVDLIRDLLNPYEPSALHCRTSQYVMMPHLISVRSSYSFEYKHDPMLYVNIYTNHHHRWDMKHAQSYILVEGTGGAAKAQIGDNLAYGINTEGQQTDYLQICSDEMTKGEWIDIDLQGRSRFPHAFIGPIAAAMRRYENKHDQPSTDIEDALKTMAIIEIAWKSWTNNMTPIHYN
ncbi:unnamed protein product [Rotaria sp. Silwood1]|nr:unnamed protein product [Rotaria sp. Silwood1]CAF0991631.1 unnamed protein product [Rotaria sp. Silwood1]